MFLKNKKVINKEIRILVKMYDFCVAFRQFHWRQNQAELCNRDVAVTKRKIGEQVNKLFSE